MRSNPALQTMRFASGDVAQRYPLPIDGQLSWQRTKRSADNLHRVELPIPQLPKGYILVPSFSMIGASDYGFQFTLASAKRSWALAPIGPNGPNAPSGTNAPRAGNPGKALATHIDYFQASRTVSDMRLTLEVHSERPPERYLLTVAARPAQISPEPGQRTSRRLTVSPLSQMTAPRNIRNHICSPTCVTMVLRHHGVTTHLKEVTRLCYHAQSRMFGVWPAALHAASRFGAIGAVETFSSTDVAAEIAERNIPLIASIRHAAGELAGACTERTGGHLVVCTGWTNDQAHVNDSRARDPRDVCTSYDRAEFARAWLRHRGASYVLLAPQ
jgi:hypothetical protein